MLKTLFLLFQSSGEESSRIIQYTLKVVKVVGIGTLSLGVVAITALFFLQRSLIYPAALPEGSRTAVALPSEFGLNRYEQVMLTTSDNVRVHAYLIKSSMVKCTKTILYLHANAGNMGHRLPIAKMLYEKLHCNILMLSYRGYGLSEGSPSEAGIQKDVDAALKFLSENEATKDNKIYLYGQSIGGAVAIDTCFRYKNDSSNKESTRAKISGLIVENTFASLRGMASHLFPYLSFASFLVLDRWDSLAKIQRLKGIPILFLAGKQDALVPPAQMLALHQAARASPDLKVTFAEFKSGNHNDTCIQPGYFEQIASWWAKNS